jgi:phospholipid/cholesterol/gamma-HCH transport system substrate-binding protein
METKASYLVVGSFVLALVAGLFLFAIWLAKFEVSREFTPYRIYFTGSISGLQEGSPVKYRGIPVGSVTRIRVNPENVEEVEVEIQVNAGTPVKEDTEASIESQALTGVGYVQLSGGTQGAPPLLPKPGKKIANIKSRPSELQRVFSSAPELLDHVTLLVDRAINLLNDHNQQAISDTLDNIKTLTGSLASRSETIGNAIDDAAATVKDMRKAAADLDSLAISMKRDMNSTLGSVKDLADNANARTTELSRDIKPVIGQLQQAAESLNRLSGQLESVVAENRRPLRDFTSQGLYQLTQLLGEARVMIASITRLTNKIESDPARFLFGDQQQGVPSR